MMSQLSAIVPDLLPGWRSFSVEGITVLDSDEESESNKQLVVMLHGFPDNVFYFYKVAPLLAKSGYRIIIPALPGYEISSSTGKLSDKSVPVLAIYMEQVIAKVVGDRRFHLIGHDWGAAIAEVIAMRKPKAILTLTMSAVPSRFQEGALKYPQQFSLSWYFFFFQMPFFPEYWFNHLGGLEYLWNSWSPKLDVAKVHPEFWKSVKLAFLQQGVASEALGYYRQNIAYGNPAVRMLAPLVFILGWLIGKVKSFGTTINSSDVLRKPATGAKLLQVPVLGLCGEFDGCIMPQLYKYLHGNDLYFPKGSVLHEIKGAGHFSFLEKPDEIANVLLRFFSNKTSSL